MDDKERCLPAVVAVLEALVADAGMRATVESRSGSAAVVSVVGDGSRARVIVMWVGSTSRLRQLLASPDSTPDTPVRVYAMARVSRDTLAWAVANGVSVLDEHGNGVLRLSGFRYQQYVESRTGNRQTVGGTPFTARASRIVRAFLSRPYHGWSQGELVSQTGISQGYASRTLALLAEHGYVSGDAGGWRVLSPDDLLDDWSSHYRFDRHERHRYAYSGGTYDDALRRLGRDLGDSGRYAYTGWSGAHLRAPRAIPPVLMAFVEHLPDRPQDIGLYPVDSGENALLIVPHDEGVLQFSQIVDSLSVATDVQVYLDLVRLPGRAKEQSEALRAVMPWKEHPDG